MKHHTLFYGSSYDRGLDVLLFIWPEVLEQFPDAQLHICYGWELFDIAAANNPERQEWKQSVQQMMKQKGIHHHGRVGKTKLKEIRKECGIWAYPTYFQEINCITALEAQNDGLVPVCTSLAALKETAEKGILVDGDIKDHKVLKTYTEDLLKLMGDKKLWKRMSNKCKKFARGYDWSKINTKWLEEFKPQKTDMRVTVYTPTVRDGWWNIMADNLQYQTHKNFEWIIVDDHKDDRSEIAAKYAQRYNLDIKYMRGKPRKTKRTYSLCNANNTALEKAEGELFVFLQDFVLIQPQALEELVRESQRHPGDFIAPVDVYYSTLVKPNLENEEDWFDGDVEVVGELLRKNIRIQGQGIRPATSLTDFEQNFGAVPTATLRALGGYYEFFDEALGFDDTEIIYRAKKLGYNLWIDEWNIAVCLDHHETLGADEGGTSVNRHRRLNDPRFEWMIQNIQKGNIPLVRTQEIDDKIDLQYEVPKEIDDEKVVEWVRSNTLDIVESWNESSFTT